MQDDADKPIPDPQAPKGLGSAFEQFKKVMGDAAKMPVPRPKKPLLVHPVDKRPITADCVEQPTKFCSICGTIMEMKRTHADCALTTGTCKRCQEQLDKGMFAFSSPDRRFAFMRSKALVEAFTKGECTQRIKISNSKMDEIQNRLKEGPTSHDKNTLN